MKTTNEQLSLGLSLVATHLYAALDNNHNFALDSRVHELYIAQGGLNVLIYTLAGSIPKTWTQKMKASRDRLAKLMFGKLPHDSDYRKIMRPLHECYSACTPKDRLDWNALNN